MNLYFANPLGWLSLLAVLPLVYLHFFRRQTRRAVVNTLFLVDKSSVNREAGNVRERWRQSASFWLQALALLLLSWLLSQPRWANSESVGKVAFVLDSSASMSAFRNEAIAEIKAAGELVEKRLSSGDYVLLETGNNAVALYRGRSLADLLDSLAAWQPRLGTHSVSERILDARNIVGANGFVIFVSDRENSEVSSDSYRVYVGSPLANVGVAGSRAFRRGEAFHWRAIVRNYGTELAKRDWWLEFEGGRSPSKSIELEAGQSLVLEGLFPEGENSVAVALSEDAFVLDDYAPVLVERPKVLSLGFSAADDNAKLFERLGKSVENCRLVGGEQSVDARLKTLSGLSALAGSGPGIYFLQSEAVTNGKIDTSVVVPSNHPWNASLSWDGLYIKGSGVARSEAGDHVLLWKGSDPLVLLKDQNLIFNFDIRNSNLDRLPAFVLLVNRFLDDLRARKPSVQALNVDTGQTLEIAYPRSGGSVELIESRGLSTVAKTISPGTLATAPRDPCFFRVEQEGVSLLLGAARFSDVRESDFEDALANTELGAFDESLVEEYYDDDFYSPVWLICLGATLLAGWFACFRENL